MGGAGPGGTAELRPAVLASGRAAERETRAKSRDGACGSHPRSPPEQPMPPAPSGAVISYEPQAAAALEGQAAGFYRAAQGRLTKLRPLPHGSPPPPGRPVAP